MENNKQLPEGWMLVDIETVAADIISGSGFPTQYQGKSEGNYPFAKVGDISRTFKAKQKFIKHADHYISEDVFKKINAKIFPIGSIVFPKIGEALRGNYRLITSREMLFDNNVMGIIPNKLVLEDYLFYFLTTQDFYKFAVATAVPSIRKGDIASISFPLAPKNEQKRIVAKIEELFSEIDKGIDNLLKAQELLKAYRQSLLKNAATGDFLVSLGLLKTAFDDSHKMNLSKAVSEHGQGWSPKCLNEPSTNENDWAVIKTTAIQNTEFIEHENKLLPKNLKPRLHLEIAPDDILVTRAGPRNRVGVTCLVRKCRKRLILCDKVYRIRVNQSVILPAYLEMLLNSPHIIDEVERLKTGINDSGVNLTQERFLALELKIPSLVLQQLTLQKLQDAISTANYLSQQINVALEKLKNIRQSILKKAFSGKLVSQDANDEPATVLLERIKAEKEIPRPQKKKSQQLQKVTV
ncbi:MAG: restriction endonuclease subunit S [Parachlamydiaceae bacterium]